jgi:hypothetical protein
VWLPLYVDFLNLGMFRFDSVSDSDQQQFQHQAIVKLNIWYQSVCYGCVHSYVCLHFIGIYLS